MQRQEGLSPRVRGNPLTASECVLYITTFSVYPRVCGGTVVGGVSTVLSVMVAVYPRVCGGTAASDGTLDCGLVQRSIPACAGEPHNKRQANVR